MTQSKPECQPWMKDKENMKHRDVEYWPALKRAGRAAACDSTDGLGGRLDTEISHTRGDKTFLTYIISRGIKQKSTLKVGCWPELVGGLA